MIAMLHRISTPGQADKLVCWRAPGSSSAALMWSMALRSPDDQRAKARAADSIKNGSGASTVSKRSAARDAGLSDEAASIAAQASNCGRLLLNQLVKAPIDVVFGAGAGDKDFLAKCLRGRLGVRQTADSARIIRIYQKADSACFRGQLGQEVEPLW